ncbi:MAG: EamA family transporter [Ignavibacteria bacterium]|nr:EamA family transporter [Ignavibacteria bacterium]
MNKIKIESALLLGILAVIWGSSFILMKKGLLAYSAPQVASMRIFISGLVFLPYIIKNFQTIPWNKITPIIIFALLEIGIPPFLYTYAQIHVDSSSAGILNCLVPLFTLSIGFLMFRLKYHFLTTLGVIIGLGGAGIITFMKSSGGTNASFDFGNWWGLLIILATVMYGAAGNILKEYLNNLSSIMLTALAFVTMAIPAGFYLLISDTFSLPFGETQHLHSFLAILVLSLFGSALAILLFSKLTKMSNALYASFVTYLIPFVSLLWGWLDGENISFIHLISMVVIFFGIYVANLGENRNNN